MKLKDMLPEELIHHSWLNCYERQVTAIWWQLVRLSSNIFILDKLAAFPFQLLVPEPLPFWELVRSNFADMSVMIIWRITLDSSTDAVTIRRLRNGIMQNLKRTEDLNELKRVLQQVGFERGISELEPQVREIRNKVLAHSNMPSYDHTNDVASVPPSLSLSDLMALQEKLHALFRTLCFGRQRAVYPLEYHPDVSHPVGTDDRPDIERLLDWVARESVVLNLPERQPQHWAHWRTNLSAEQLETLNQYRQRFGLPAV
jgi:hypothetical protein